MSSPSPESLELASLFARKAREDAHALRILSDAEGTSDAVVGFHAQQAVEKFVKAVLVAAGVDVPRAHDLRFLLDLADENEIDVPDNVRAARWLTPWAVEFRYGGDLTDPFDRGRAIADVEAVAEWAAARLPEP